MYIFDLGGVVIKTEYETCYKIWGRYANQPPNLLLEKFKWDEAFRALEIGKISAQEYFRHWAKLLDIDITYDEFVEGCHTMFIGLDSEIISSLEKIKRKVKLIALTNTSEIHMSILPEIFPELYSIFEKIYASNEIGLRKPEKSCFEYVLACENHKPEEVVFFDDNPRIVSAAIELGMNGILVKGPEDVLKVTETI